MPQAAQRSWSRERRRRREARSIAGERKRKKMQ